MLHLGVNGLEVRTGVEVATTGAPDGRAGGGGYNGCDEDRTDTDAPRDSAHGKLPARPVELGPRGTKLLLQRGKCKTPKGYSLLSWE
jgi:hypothetical protein